MLSWLPEDIEAYLERHSSPESPLLAQLAEETRKRAENPQMMVGHTEGLFLRSLVRMTGARRVLELGTFTGYSALTMAEALPADGEILTCERDPAVAEIARRYWSRSPHGRKIRLLLGPALDSIERVDPPFDMVFLDADKEQYVEYWEACLPKLRPGGVFVADNVLWSGGVLFPKTTEDRAIAAFNERVSGDDRVESVFLPIRDGLSLSIKRADR